MKFYFAPDEDCLTPLLDAVSTATKSILVADYSFNIPQLTDLIIAKKQAGVRVRVVLDRSQSIGKHEALEILKLASAKIDYVIGTSDKHQIMHLKVLVIDNETVLFGSYNFTTNAQSQDNVLAVESSVVVAKSFTKQIRHIYLYILHNEPQGLQLIVGESMNYKDIAIRAVKTFGQVFVTSLILSSANLLQAPSLSVAEKLLLSLAVGAATIVWNTVLVPVFEPVTSKLGLSSKK